MAREFFWLVELPGIVVEGLVNGEEIVIVYVEGEMARFAVECGIACDSEAFGVVEDDVWILMGNAGVEPGKAASGELEFGGGDALEDGCPRR